MTVKLFNPGNYATFSETCAKCHKNNETKMCKKCIEDTAEEGEMCYGDDGREHFVSKCKEHFEDSGMEVPKTPEQYLTIIGAYTGTYVCCLSLCSLFALII